MVHFRQKTLNPAYRHRENAFSQSEFLFLARSANLRSGGDKGRNSEGRRGDPERIKGLLDCFVSTFLAMTLNSE